MPAAVLLDGVTVLRGGKPVLAELDLRMSAGEHWVVLGPNGAGKTTLMSLLGTLAFPTRGTMELLGEKLGLVDVFELRPRIGMSSAALVAALAETATALEAVRTAAFGMTGSWREEYDPADTERALALLGQWDMAGMAERRIGTLSEGERKRVLIARALMADPELLLLDEPAAGLDVAGREQLVAALGRLTARAAAPVCVLVTHHVEEIPGGMTHALLLRDGRSVAAGPIAEVLTSASLSATFGIGLELHRHRTPAGTRFTARLSQ